VSRRIAISPDTQQASGYLSLPNSAGPKLMVELPSYLADCHDVLTDGRMSAAERTYEAGKLFWKAVICHDTWPKELVDRAGILVHRLVDCGIIGQSNRNIDPAATVQLCRDLKAFVEDFQRFATADVEIVTVVREAQGSARRRPASFGGLPVEP
jgi:hypothetical protein